MSRSPHRSGTNPIAKYLQLQRDCACIYELKAVYSVLYIDVNARGWAANTRDYPRSDVTMVGRAGGPADGWLDFAQPDLRPEHAVIRELAHEFAERRLRPQAARMDAEDYFPRDLFAAAGEAGLIGIA